MLHPYGEALKIENPGTVFDVELEDGLHFKYLFMALGACIRGFSSCRPVVIVDGGHLKEKYKGTMLVAVSMDDNKQVYPLASGIVDTENDRSWKWFMSKLKCCIGEPADLVFVSDRMVSIGNAIRAIFPTTFHGLCTYHIERNLFLHFKDSAIVRAFKDAARAFRMSDFQDNWNKLCGFRDGAVTKYLEEIGIEWWARVFHIHKRYDNMTSNRAECFNALTKEFRLWPITSLLEDVRSTCQAWFYKRMNLWASRSTMFSDYCEQYLAVKADKGRRYKVEPIDCYRVNVRDRNLDGIVNLHTKACTCKEFDSNRIPCSHAIVVARERNIPIESICSRYYTVESLMSSYAEAINPLGHRSEWKRSPGYVETNILPPRIVARVGRQRVRRIPSRGEHRRLVKCGRCRQYGHNRQNCTEPLTIVGNGRTNSNVIQS